MWTRLSPAIVIALVFSCTGRLTEIGADTAPITDAGVAINEPAPSASSGGGDGCIPGGAPATIWNDKPGLGGIVSDGVNVFWPSPTAIESCPIAGCGSAPQRIAPVIGSSAGFAVPQIAVDSTNLYFSAPSSVDGGPESFVYRCPKTGCVGAPEVVASTGDQPSDVFLSDDSIYWTTCDYSPTTATCTAMRIGKDGTGLRAFSGAPTVQAVSKDAIFWTILTGPALEFGSYGSILSCPISGCDEGPTVIAANQKNIAQIALDDANIYWLVDGLYEKDGAVLSCPLTGCNGAPTTIASGQYDPAGIVVDSCAVYWFNDGSPADSANWRLGDIYVCEKPSCNGTPTTIATDQNYVAGLAVDPHGVYWTTYQGGTVSKLAR
jgi:hypothetical protein